MKSRNTCTIISLRSQDAPPQLSVYFLLTSSFILYTSSSHLKYLSIFEKTSDELFTWLIIVLRLARTFKKPYNKTSPVKYIKLRFVSKVLEKYLSSCNKRHASGIMERDAAQVNIMCLIRLRDFIVSFILTSNNCKIVSVITELFRTSQQPSHLESRTIIVSFQMFIFHKC